MSVHEEQLKSIQRTLSVIRDTQHDQQVVLESIQKKQVQQNKKMDRKQGQHTGPSLQTHMISIDPFRTSNLHPGMSLSSVMSQFAFYVPVDRSFFPFTAKTVREIILGARQANVDMCDTHAIATFLARTEVNLRSIQHTGNITTIADVIRQLSQYC